MNATHQYIDRNNGQIRNEVLFSDRIVNWLYHPVRENMPRLFRLMTGAKTSRALGFFNYDLVLAARVFGHSRFVREAGVDLGECLDPPRKLDTARKLFERKIRYWQCRPLPEDPRAVVSPADSRVIVGSLDEVSGLMIKNKFFSYEELLGRTERGWRETFRSGDFALFRLTPDKYHYNHTPVSGKVVDYYLIDGRFHSCNPNAIVSTVTPYSKNRRVVTVIDTDVSGGSGIGKVAMIEIVALMIGDIQQCYSRVCYDDPREIKAGMMLARGCPKSLFRPGSSTVVLLFEKKPRSFCRGPDPESRPAGCAESFFHRFSNPAGRNRHPGQVAAGAACRRVLMQTRSGKND